ncbi:ketoacyl-ACP synthase III [Xanthomarina sp. F1114]|uniref:3-oxoacyl-ACP synthase III family protein n=1 Tax=Xanthomarina sp. F1114 TaxID=2996019 RepID=UPI00225DE05F|nr:ketoacyl-ACP synthase III [Xanthomarina sp. F1114]MCX7548870.1 ketoacyl-ACP synthase III [Xanthomarina sp. F1114]
MAELKFSGIHITGMAGAVPAQTIKNRAYTEHFDKEAVNDIVDKTGVEERRFATESTTASDLCYAAAEKLIADMEIDKSEIDVLLFVSQTPDYRMPATSIILQNRLGLSKSTAAFDISLGCSGFVYGLSVAYGYAQQPGIRKVLLLDGETRSKVYHPKDRKTGFIFGDAGVAAIIEKDTNIGDSFFSLNSDGSLQNLIKIDAGGYRNRSTSESLKEKVVDEHGNIRTDEHGYMNGADVFNFVLREIPRNIKQTLKFADAKLDDFDYYIFHQANKFMNDYLIKKLKLDVDKVPTTIAKYGNTSSVSIPITMVDQLKDKTAGDKNLLLCGFGVGMSWATACIPTQDLKISEIVEVS